ncbi:DNA polymerase III subunit gamma/tau [Leuconostocaceae bacterium ESL0958]|nr:DNA polymerase III subunit gamma/tau [Leuconostocaceae bacterium ESL0958]
MAYQALYRKYRPRTFADMVGQEVITQTLQNAIDSQQTGHAYLFAGPRGTGKTSAAKIFARAVNHIPASEAGENQPDIIEIDAASNNGVDEIRSIRDSANYAPMQAPFKIYIIDEAHMLSTGAFNALLKTLEEPPAQVKFILATTEVQKMPATILSRTQRFEFKRISHQTLKERMATILDKEELAYEDGALDVVATAAEGGMRDALSILDQVIAYGPDKITVENALTVTGAVNIESLLTYLKQVLAGETTAALATLAEILQAGKDGHRFLADLVAVLRDTLLVTVAPDLVKAQAQKASLTALREQTNPAVLEDMMGMIDQLNQQLVQALQEDVYLEVLTVKLAQGQQEAAGTTAARNSNGEQQNGAAPSQPAGQSATQQDLSQQSTVADTIAEGSTATVATAASDTRQSSDAVTSPAPTAAVAQAKDEAAEQPTQQARTQADGGLEEAPAPATAAAGNQSEGRAVDHSDGTASKPASQPTRPAASAAVTTAAATGTAPAQAEDVKGEAAHFELYLGQEAVQAVLGQAQRAQLTQAQQVWPQLATAFSVKDQALLQTIQPVAASATALVLAFDYPALLEQTLHNAPFLTALAEHLQQQDLPNTLVCRSKEEWQTDRADYVAALKAQKTVKIDLAVLTPTTVTGPAVDQANESKENRKVPAQQAAKTEQDDLVADAKARFGDLVELVDDENEG